MTERLHFHFHALEKEMATHSSVLAWRIPGMEEPGELLSMGLHRVGHDWSDLAVAAAVVRGYWIGAGVTRVKGGFPRGHLEKTVSLREIEAQNSQGWGQIFTLESIGMVPGVLPNKSKAFQCLAVTVWIKLDPSWPSSLSMLLQGLPWGSSG